LHRDLSSPELWQESLRRSRKRRLRRGRRTSPVSVIRPLAVETSQARDLALVEYWEDSVSRSLRRRHAAELRFGDRPTAARRISTVAVAAAIAAPASSLAASKGGASSGSGSASPPTLSAQRLLTRGSQGADVAVVQQALGIGADGIYGRATASAVQSFQSTHNLAVDDIVGPYTRAALGLGSSAPVSTSGSVATVQRALGISADGVLGPQTEQAIVSFQARHGLASDGVVGPVTAATLGIGSLSEDVGHTVASAGPAAIPAGATTPQQASAPQTAPTQTAPSRSVPTTQPAPQPAGESPQTAPSGSGSGVAQMISAADQIATKPYVYGGGHGSWKSSGYDCSGSVSYVLHRAGLLKRPEDSTGLMSYGQAGAGKHVTIYSNSQHAYMVINGRRFDTSGQRISGSRWTQIKRSSAGFVARHPGGY
jgi:peptidoglycan hydrolase-like protein with peptidoglycan-binding domain